MNRLLAVSDDAQGVDEAGLHEGALGEQDVVRVVLHHEDREIGQVHRHQAFSSSIQKRLPLRPSDSTPQVPSMRDTALRTMARPMPVPG